MLYESEGKLVLYAKKSFITCLLKAKKAIIILRNKGFKANMHSFINLIKSRNKLRVFLQVKGMQKASIS